VANSGQKDDAWTVTYASTNGGATAATGFEGTSYVINTTNTTYGTQYPAPPWAANTTSAEWITAPGAYWAVSGGTTGNGAVNAGGDGLPGYGTDTTALSYTASTSVIYVYTTTFTITGNATAGTAITGLTMQLSVAGDNTFAVFVNPSNTATALAQSTAKFVAPSNAYTYAPLNVSLSSGFVVGVNTISIEVQNAGGSNSISTNFSGVMVYGSNFIGAPEVGSWVPVAAAALLYALWAWRRARPAVLAAA
jgi:hypothetical protein